LCAARCSSRKGVSDIKETFEAWGNTKKAQPLKLALSQTCTKS